jgi:MFS family permease
VTGGFGVVRERSLLALVSGEFISSLGSQMTALALPWFVLVTTGSPTRMGFVFAAELVPVVLLGVQAGVVVERLGPRATMLLSDAARAPIVALVPLLYEIGGLSYALILVVAALHGLFSTVYFTCQRVVIPAVVGADEQRVGQANTLVEGATNLTNFVGPALAGVLIGVLGAANVMWIDAASYVVSFLLVSSFVRVAREAHEPGESGGVWAGVAYLRRDTLIGRVSLSALVYGFLFPILIASFPVLAFTQYHRNPRVAGLLLSAFGGGAVVGAVAAYKILGRLAPLRLATIGIVGLSGPLWLLVPHTPLAVVVAALAISGFSNPLINAPYLGMLVTRVPQALQPKVMQAVITANRVAAPLGYAVAGPLIVGVGLHSAYAITAGLATVAAVNFVLAVSRSGALVQETA